MPFAWLVRATCWFGWCAPPPTPIVIPMPVECVTWLSPTRVRLYYCDPATGAPLE